MPLPQQQVTPDAILAELVGAAPTTRPQITKALWDYIKRTGAQDAVNRRQINAATPELRRFFGGANSATMFELPAFVSLHVTKSRGPRT